MVEETKHPQLDKEEVEIDINDLHLDESELTPDEELPPADGGVA